LKEIIAALPCSSDPAELEKFICESHGDDFYTDPEKRTLQFSGDSDAFSWHILGADVSVPELFASLSDLSPEDKNHILTHKSLLFLVRQLKHKSELGAIIKGISFFAERYSPALYFEHSGECMSSRAWAEIHQDSEIADPDPFYRVFRYKENLYTLGLQVLGLADLCIKVGEDVLQAEETIRKIAHHLFLSETQVKSHDIIEDPDTGHSVRVTTESATLFKKTDAEFNPKGLLRLTPQNRAL
jgi:hypothetical protein